MHIQIKRLNAVKVIMPNFCLRLNLLHVTNKFYISMQNPGRQQSPRTPDVSVYFLP